MPEGRNTVTSAADLLAISPVIPVAGPLPQLRFCPTGGISVKTAPKYLALANVGCVGGSWLTPAGAMAASDWERIELLAAEAATIQFA